MDTTAGRVLVRYVVDVWVDVDLTERSVDRVVVDTGGLARPLEVLHDGGQVVSDSMIESVLELVEGDTWPSWDFE